MSSPVRTLPGPRRAAVLLVLLGEEAASRLCRHLAPEELTAIAREIAALDRIPPDLAQEVLEAYFLDAVKPPEQRGGPEVARRILQVAQVPEDVLERAFDGGPADHPLGPLAQAPPEVLAAALADEHAQTRALVLMCLPPDKGARVLALMNDEDRADTVARMSSVDRVRGNLLGEVRATLQERLQADDDEEEGPVIEGGLDRAAEVLQNLPRVEIRKLLQALEGKDPERAAALRDKIFTFESLVLADDRGIQELLRGVETKTLALALHGAPQAVQDKFLGNLSERAANMLREEMDYLGTIRPEDQAAARKEILEAALRLEAEEKLVFQEPGSGS